MLSKRKIIDKCFETNDDFSKELYSKVINYFYEKNNNLEDLLVDKNMKLKNFFMIINSIPKRVNKLIKDYNLLDEFKLVHFKMYELLEHIINTIYYMNESHFDEHITEESFMSKIKEFDSSLINKFIKKYPFKKLVKMYNNDKFSNEMRISFFIKDLIIDDLKLAKYYEKDKISELSQTFKKILEVFLNMFHESGRKDFKIHENKVLSFSEFKTLN